jgi:hypothetical protein
VACSDDPEPAPVDAARDRGSDLAIVDASGIDVSGPEASTSGTDAPADSSGGGMVVMIDGPADTKGRTVTGAGCHDLAFSALVDRSPLPSVPSFTGGTVTDGTFDAIKEEIAAAATERTATSIRLQGGNYAWVRFIESSGNRNDFEERTRGTFATAGNTLSLAGNCGSSVVRMYSFTASGDDLLVYQEGLLLRMRRRQ